MSSQINLNKMQIEARPFFTDRPFINPDKALAQYELPLKKNFLESLRRPQNPFAPDSDKQSVIDYRI